MTDAYCFTINNYTEKDLAAVISISAPYFVVFGREVGASGTPHLQGTIWREDEVRIRRDRMCKLLGGRAHLEVCHDLCCSIAYCVKDFDVFCNAGDLTDLARKCYEKTNCRWFIGSVLYNWILARSVGVLEEIYDDRFLDLVFFHHVNMKTCKFCRKSLKYH